MKRTVPAILALLVLAGCGPGGVRQSSKSRYPAGACQAVSIVDLAVSVNDKSMIVSWREIGQSTISGYNIYISERPLSVLYPDAYIDSSVAPYNLSPFPGDTDPEDGVEYFEATDLENGVRYYVTIRVVYPDGSVSGPSDEVAAVCGPRGEIELPIRYQSSPDGYSFEKNAYTDANSTANDLYFYSKDGYDYLASPRRLDGFINDTRFLVLPFRGSFDEVVAHLAEFEPGEAEDQVQIFPGDWVLASCERGTNALLEVKAIKGSGKERRVALFFAYSTIVEEIVF
jgi:hypothetical protein